MEEEDKKGLSKHKIYKKRTIQSSMSRKGSNVSKSSKAGGGGPKRKKSLKSKSTFQDLSFYSEDISPKKPPKHGFSADDDEQATSMFGSEEKSENDSEEAYIPRPSKRRSKRENSISEDLNSDRTPPPPKNRPKKSGTDVASDANSTPPTLKGLKGSKSQEDVLSKKSKKSDNEKKGTKKAIGRYYS
eukprot:CAMPEP_0114595406 /NCGR_PEP_ID=MMETSP0125-20121206/17198_1 /TAXON_ID=485358 ORGANISM="Aristerostoma sp., Strain ATCC 50986" /NCGR_SAMPLE_ID=MMETSP0125 /ASSEMBLY_ACC=CAM_ASM_000245 /LENGTH=186 /DNA_ID=CAMNT_0001796949 /DNA_START=70 /DNA_END=631 /DNA_ORIENTATION=-